MLNFNFKFIVNTADKGQRLDVFVTGKISKLSRSQIKRLAEDGMIRLNGADVKASKSVSAGDVVEIKVPEAKETSIEPQNIPIDIIYEDSDIIVVNKPAGMVTHPAPGHHDGTLVNALLWHCHDLSGIGGELKPGIVHRLDQGTSGCIVAAKNDEAHRLLADQFKLRTVSKTYLALIFGSPRTDTGSYDTSIGRSVSDRKRMSTRTNKGRVALTQWKVIERFDKVLSLIEVSLKTGRMHQIRVHFAEDNHPLVGDPVYGGAKRAKQIRNPQLREILGAFPRPALHSWRLKIAHPATKKWMNFMAEIPKDFSSLIEEIRFTENSWRSYGHCISQRTKTPGTRIN